MHLPGMQCIIGLGNVEMLCNNGKFPSWRYNGTQHSRPSITSQTVSGFGHSFVRACSLRFPKLLPRGRKISVTSLAIIESIVLPL